MAQDAREKLSPITEKPEGLVHKKSQITLLEPPAVGGTSRPSDSSRSGPGSDTRSVERPRSSTLDSSAGPPGSTIPSAADGPSRDHDRDRPSTPNIRTLPGWVRSVEFFEDKSDVMTHLLPPGDAVVAQHNFSPHSNRGPDINHVRGDSLDQAGFRASDRQSRWKTFSRSIAYPRSGSLQEKLVTTEWLNENLGDYTQPWLGGHRDEEDLEQAVILNRRRQIWYKRFQTTLLRSPIVPLIFRLTVWVFSLTALALGGSIQHLSDVYKHAQGPSAMMAIVVDAVALVYLFYVTWDEYTGKPLGLRAPRAKMRLILLDIFFIVFDSANLSLAFESLSDVTGSCTDAEVNKTYDPRNDEICDRQKALASVLLVALIAWLMTFSISVLRLVERVSQK